jgi:hypothetical protein
MVLMIAAERETALGRHESNRKELVADGLRMGNPGSPGHEGREKEGSSKAMLYSSVCLHAEEPTPPVTIEPPGLRRIDLGPVTARIAAAAGVAMPLT